MGSGIPTSLWVAESVVSEDIIGIVGETGNSTESKETRGLYVASLLGDVRAER